MDFLGSESALVVVRLLSHCKTASALPEDLIVHEHSCRSTPVVVCDCSGSLPAAGLRPCNQQREYFDADLALAGTVEDQWNEI